MLKNLADTATLLDSLSTSLLLLDKNDAVLGLNPAAENLFGTSTKRAAGQKAVDLVPDNRDFADLLNRVRNSGQAYARELQIRPTGLEIAELVVDVRVTPYSEYEGSLIVEIADVTRRAKISREKAMVAQHDVGRKIIRQLAHEIKNPLGGLRGAAQLLERQLADPSLKEYTHVIVGEADRLAALVDALLGPGGSPKKAPINVHELLEHVAKLLSAQTNNTLHIEREYDPSLPLLELDRGEIIQALLNIANNALCATGEHGRIILRTCAVSNFTIGKTRHGTVASIEIEDDGPGIPAELQESIFYPLVTGRAEGTGIGLTVAQEMVNRHGGLIEFSSRPGETVFRIRMPLDQPAVGNA